MINYINVTNRVSFEQAIADISNCDIMACDTETNGLNYYRENYIISISVYIPALEIGYNFPFRHGQGTIDPAYNAPEYQGMNWQGNAKKAMFLDYWRLHHDRTYTNLPEAWLDELRTVWTMPQTHVYHNARFDLHMLKADGFDAPANIIDTLLQAHVLLEDWRGATFEAPYTNGRKDDGAYGTWARFPDGKLKVKKQPGNRRLKWQTAYLQHKDLISTKHDATIGEDQLHAAALAYEDALTTHIMNHLDDATLDGLVYAAVKKNPAILQETVKSSKKDNPEITWYEKQYNRIRKYIKIDKKSNMWLLDSPDVYYYAILDTWLTWELHLFQRKQLENWHNIPLADTLNDMQLHVAFAMEHNGLVLDRSKAISEQEKLHPRIDELQTIFDAICIENGIEPHSIASPKKLASTLTALVPVQFKQSVYPAWWEYERPTETYNRTFHKADKEALDSCDENPIVRMVLEYRRMKKTADTYLSRWLESADKNNIVRPGINLDGTKTGRTSSSGDMGNAQNIPDRNGYTVKRAFITPSDEWLFFAIDYGQLEARLAAWYAELLLKNEGVHTLPATMLDLFEGRYDIARLQTLRPDIDETRFLKSDGSVDMHAFTREVINVRRVVFGDMSDKEILLKRGYDLSKLQNAGQRSAIVDSAILRQMAKTLNFGLLYSGTEYMASKLLKISLEQARPLVSAWRALFPAFGLAQQHYTELALKRRPVPSGSHYAQYVTQEISGRHRRLHRYPTWLRFKKNGVWQAFNPQESWATKCWNSQVQGLGGYMTPYALLRFSQEVGYEGVKPFAIIHDAIDGYVHRSHLDKIPKLMRIMTDFDVRPSLTVDLEFSSTTWQDMQHVNDVDEWIKEWTL